MIKVPDLSIIIVSFNTQELLKKCLMSLMVNGKWLMVNSEVIVVDNASKDSSSEMVKKEFPKVKLIVNEHNLGFATANDQGIKASKGEGVFLLNSDTEVKPGALEKLVEFIQIHSEVGVVGARLLNPDGSIQSSVYHFPTIWRAIKEYWLGQKGEYDKYAPAENEPMEVEAVTGAAMLIPRRTIEKIGLLDERYFMYFEDLDYCQRVKQAGLKVYYLPEAEILHRHGQSASKSGPKAYQYLIQSSKIYNGRLKYHLLTLIIGFGQKWQKIFGKK